MKAKITFFILAAFFLFQSSSPWEGAGTMAPAGELPEVGYYVATNSFPRNTVVDITNIETNKSTRVIVANSLNSPGLLAVVSREAADLIGMREGSVSRIRMVQPSDPIAYLRFTEEVSTGGYDYDSGDVINEENLLIEHYSEDTYVPEPVLEEPVIPEVAGYGGPGYLLEPEWGGRGQSIIDLPGYIVPPADQYYETPPQDDYPYYYAETDQPYYYQQPEQYPYYYQEQPQQQPLQQPELRAEIVKDVSKKIEETPPKEVVKDVPNFMDIPDRRDINKDTSPFMAEETRDEIIKQVPEYLAEKQRDEVVKDIPEKVEYTAKEPEQTEYVMVPSEEKKPEGIYGIDPSLIIPGISAPPKTEPVRPTVTDSSFSIPRIFELDKGKYYVQVAAVNTPELVDNTARQIDQHYNPVVYKDGDNWYRILLGPLNQGESAAVLQRFKSIGYKDAFVRHAR